jgi:6-phosphogluconolactonase
VGTELVRVADHEEAAQRASELIIEAGRTALAERGEFALALSGGKDPWRMVELVSEANLEWERTTIFQVDERIAPAGDDDRNLTHMVEALPIDLQTRIRPMPVTDGDLEAAAARYAAELPDKLDAVHLGIGPDGHTASLVPDDPVLEVTDRKVAITGGEYQDRRRMTVTYPVLAAARMIVWLVTGDDKQDALAKLRAGDESVPAGRVRNDAMTIVADASALGDA